MADLSKQVSESAEKLEKMWLKLENISNSSLPQKCFEQWKKRAKLHQTLRNTVDIFPARASAWAAVQSVFLPEKGRDLKKVTYSSLEMDFSVARHLALTAYMAVTWSAYDRLANVCGRLTTVKELAENPKQNPKVIEDFLSDKKDTMGFACHQHLQQAYSWPLKVSYKIRNWLVHEGYEEEGIPLFQSESISDGFILHDNAVQNLKKYGSYSDDNGKIDRCCFTSTKDPWQRRDLLQILPAYHEEIDTMFTSLVKWSVDSFVGQVTTFSDRDKHLFMTAALESGQP